MDNINIDNTEVTDGTDAGAEHLDGEPGVAETTEAVTPGEEGAEATGADELVVGVPDGSGGVPAGTVEDAGAERSTEGGGDQGVADADTGGVTEPAYDYTDVYANDGTHWDCTTLSRLEWFEQKVVGFKVEEDGSVTMVDIGTKAERFTDVYPMTADEAQSHCGVVPVAEVPEVPTPDVVSGETSTATVSTPPVLAETGAADMGVPVTLGAIALIVIGGWLIANAVAKKIGRKNK